MHLYSNIAKQQFQSQKVQVNHRLPAVRIIYSWTFGERNEQQIGDNELHSRDTRYVR